MKSRNNNNQNIQQRTTSSENKTPLSKRRLKTKPTLTVLAILLVGNVFWFVLWILASFNSGSSSSEAVATVDGETITRQQWMASMENLYGKETLHSLINEKVMEKASKAYGIQVTDEEIDLELSLIRSTQDGTDHSLEILEDKQLRQKVRSQLILEKVLTKDIVIEEEAVMKFYEENKNLFNIPTTYRTSLIVVNNINDAQSVKQELTNGSEFSVLARERSLDTSSASLGGNIGYITTSQTNIDPEIPKVIENLEMNEISEPFLLSDGQYGIAYVTEIIESKSFTYEEVQEHIKRELAIDQLSSTVTPEMFWDEFKASSFYLN